MPGRKAPPQTLHTATAAVVAVMAAQNHYETLGAHRAAPDSELRQRYLQTSERVHPDTNCHPDAAEAFQRVVQAWQCLSDGHSRRVYDAELAQEEAMLAYLRQMMISSEMATHQDNVFGAELPLRPPQRALRVASSDQVAQGVASAWEDHAFRLGFHKVVNVASGSIQLLQSATSEVRHSIVEQVGKLCLTKSSEPATLAARECTPKAGLILAQRFWKMGTQVTKPFGCMFESHFSDVPLCLEACTQAADGDVGQGSIDPGTRVKISGLRSAVHLNGKVGVVLAFDERKVRYKVNVFSMKIQPPCHEHSSSSSSSAEEVKFIKFDNMKILSSMPSAPLMTNEQFM